MDCSVDRIANYLSCYGSAIRAKKKQAVASYSLSTNCKLSYRQIVGRE